ncbi:G5 domain-containing protein, partial [Actinomyces qiguomingii]
MTPINDLLKPGMLRAGGAAAVLALSVSGGAYAGVQAAAPGGDAERLPETAVVASAASANGAASETTDLVVGGDVAEVLSVSEDVTDAFERVERQTDALAEGETEVETEGVDGVTRVVYRVISVDGRETAREVVSRVVVSERVDEVVLVGTGAGSG